MQKVVDIIMDDHCTTMHVLWVLVYSACCVRLPCCCILLLREKLDEDREFEIVGDVAALQADSSKASNPTTEPNGDQPSTSLGLLFYLPYCRCVLTCGLIVKLKTVWSSSSVEDAPWNRDSFS